MTEAGWTRATDVTQPGWYWLRRVGSLTVVQVIAVPGYEPKHWIVEGANLRWSLGNMDGEFLGPITPDSYQQGRVAGLWEAVDIMRQHCVVLADGECETHANNGVREALTAIAQQAQEGGVGDEQRRLRRGVL